MCETTLSKDDIENLSVIFQKMSPADQAMYVTNLALQCGDVKRTDRIQIWTFYRERSSRARYNAACHYLLIRKHRAFMRDYGGLSVREFVNQ